MNKATEYEDEKVRRSKPQKSAKERIDSYIDSEFQQQFQKEWQEVVDEYQRRKLGLSEPAEPRREFEMTRTNLMAVWFVFGFCVGGFIMCYIAWEIFSS